eukprot:TRINITY_DN12170_c0_g1_i1.p1 TRINITY_DN12170_c0_g1~~TRINITY_DN12170_c0_g1_i1.p1  ORF type:complete len:207 (+),score=49.81 TRINITY_DN12170_c0_g1_i1:120-740(+)
MQVPHDDAKRVQKLQERDADVEAIKAYSKFAVAYFLHQDSNNPGWRKANLEGPVYIVQRRSKPRYQLWVVQDNASLDSKSELIDDLCPGWELDCQKNYVFYKVENPQEKIRGLWFHDDAERQRMEGALENLLNEIRAGKDEDRHPMGNHQVQDQLYSQFGLRNDQGGSDDKVVITKASLRQALHTLVDDDNFLNAVMQKLKDKSPQ